jgi:N-acetylglutamate synthase-like GNAT family acetyltransferase
MNLTTRPAHSQDLEGITLLSNQLGYQTTLNQTISRFTAVQNREDHCVLVALHLNEIVGWIHGNIVMRMESDAFVEIGGLVVSEQYRRKGIGHLLVENMQIWQKMLELSRLVVRCNTIRKESHQFYEGIGFKLKKEQKIFEK